MSSDRIIVDAIKVAQDLLQQNLPPTHNLTDAATVMRFRELVRSQAIRSALEVSSDTLPAFALRAVERVVSDQSQTNRETIPIRSVILSKSFSICCSASAASVAAAEIANPDFAALMSLELPDRGRLL